MTQDVINNQNVEIKNLQNIIAGKDKGIDGLQAQLEATKQAFNEMLNGNMQLRTHIILMQKDGQKLLAELEALKKESARLLEMTKAPKQSIMSEVTKAPVEQGMVNPFVS